MKHIVMTGGGSSGHVTPNIALFPYLKEAGYRISYIGTESGIEKDLIKREKIDYYSIKAGKLRRYISLKNITDFFDISAGLLKAASILKKIKPEIIFSKGGFVSCPVVWAGWLCRIPVIIHESDMTPGLSNRLCFSFARKICYTFPETLKYLPSDKAVLTGIPIRGSLHKGSAEKGLELCNFTKEKPVILIVGGSLGAEIINSTIRKVLNTLLKDFQIIHICGKGNVDRKYDGLKGYIQFEYVNEEQSHLYAAADLFVCRAGATTLFEAILLGKPNLLIPLSKAASRGDQILNALSFEKQGYSRVLQEEELSGQSLLDSIKQTYIQRAGYVKRMQGNMAANSSETILNLIEECCK